MLLLYREPTRNAARRNYGSRTVAVVGGPGVEVSVSEVRVVVRCGIVESSLLTRDWMVVVAVPVVIVGIVPVILVLGEDGAVVYDWDGDDA